MSFRTEKDFLGEKQIPSSAYFGIQTARAMENFRISGIPVSTQPYLIIAYAEVKKAAALANRDCGVLANDICEAIVAACDRLIRGELHDQFSVDLIQGGAGTSINMNVNEVIANAALEAAGYQKGQYDVIHPNNHVNCSQSTNDTYPVAVAIALVRKVRHLLNALGALGESFGHKTTEFANVLKMGRTQLQDAVPMFLGQEFAAYAENTRLHGMRVQSVVKELLSCNLGGTAIGTGVNAPSGYSLRAIAHLAAITNLPLVPASNLVNASFDMSPYVALSGTLKNTAIAISKICNDLRLLSSGPRCGIDEINLPRMQPGSSIMPGKINPVIPEVVNQTAFYVCGADTTITMAAEAGQLELNVMEPVIAFSLFTSLDYLTNAIGTLVGLCVKGITVNEGRCRDYVMNSIGIVTLLNPVLGYEKAAEIAREAADTGKALHTLVVGEKKLLTQEQWDTIFTVANMVHTG